MRASHATPALVLLACGVLLGGCLRLKYDRCAQLPPHPECLDAGTDAGPPDAPPDSPAEGPPDAPLEIDAATSDSGG
jgi:hypothetical protein